MANRQNKIKKKLWYKSISDYYEKYDVDNKPIPMIMIYLDRLKILLVIRSVIKLHIVTDIKLQGSFNMKYF